LKRERQGYSALPFLSRLIPKWSSWNSLSRFFQHFP